MCCDSHNNMLFSILLLIGFRSSIDCRSLEGELIRHLNSPNGEGKSSQVPLLFTDQNEYDIDLQVKDIRGKIINNLSLTFDEQMVQKNNVTVQQVRKAYIEAQPNGEKYLVVGTRRILFGIEKETTRTVFHDANGVPQFAMDMEYFNKLTMKDIDDDSTLLAEKKMKLSWPILRKCHWKSFQITITGYSTEIIVNGQLVSSYHVANHTRGKTAHYEDEGILLTVLNPTTCTKTLETVAHTSDFGGYRELQWSLQSVSAGRLIILSSLRDGAHLFNKSSIDMLSNLGSIWSHHYLYRDSFLNVFFKGGKTIFESLVPNVLKLNNSGSPIYFDIDPNDLQTTGNVECRNWPISDRWEARHDFCQINDGYSTLCSCDSPFDFDDGPPRDEIKETREIPLIIIAGNRTRHLMRLFENLAKQDGVIRRKVLLISDGQVEGVAKLAFILDLHLLVHKVEGDRATRISRNLRFALYNGLKVFPDSQQFIVLEDDLVVSPDFYSYMTQMAPIFEMDSSIFCVSAFNHNSYPHTSSDPALTYRVQAYPAYGWMMSRNIIEEIVPKWLPSNFNHDWDYYVGSSIIRRERECVVPDINRSYHFGTSGFHMGASFFSESHYLSRNINKLRSVKLTPLKRLIKENYENEYTKLLSNCEAIEFEVRENFEKILRSGGIYCIFLHQNEIQNISSFRLIGQELGMWTMDDRDSHNHSWRFPYRNATVFIIGVPLSPYRSYMPKHYPVLIGDNETDAEVNSAENIARSSLIPHTHFKGFNLPSY